MPEKNQIKRSRDVMFNEDCIFKDDKDSDKSVGLVSTIPKDLLGKGGGSVMLPADPTELDIQDEQLSTSPDVITGRIYTISESQDEKSTEHSIPTLQSDKVIKSIENPVQYITRDFIQSYNNYESSELSVDPIIQDPVRKSTRTTKGKTSA